MSGSTFTFHCPKGCSKVATGEQARRESPYICSKHMKLMVVSKVKEGPAT